MSKKKVPSFELKQIIWDIAATVGKDKHTAIQRQLGYELQKRRQEGEFFEDEPDTRTISNIVEEINELDPEIVVSRLPTYVWKLRRDHEYIRQIAESKGQSSEASELSREHDREVFKQSDNIMSEVEIRDFLGRLKSSCTFLFSELLVLDAYIDFFKLESNKYILSSLRNPCDELRKNLSKLHVFLYTEFDTLKQLKKKTRRCGGIKYLEAVANYIDNQEDTTFILHPELRDKNFLHYTHPYYARKDDPVYLSYKNQLREIVEETLQSYVVYRAAVRETLLI